MGKVSFCDLQDKSGRIQIYARKDEMDEEAYDRFRKYDIGDIVGVSGDAFKTKTGRDLHPCAAGHAAAVNPCARCRRSSTA